MRDHLDTQTSAFLENGTTFNAIYERFTNDDPDQCHKRRRVEDVIQEADDAMLSRPVIDMDKWETTTPIVSLFDVLPSAPVDTVATKGRPMTKPEAEKAEKRKKSANTYKMIADYLGGEV